MGGHPGRGPEGPPPRDPPGSVKNSLMACTLIATELLVAEGFADYSLWAPPCRTAALLRVQGPIYAGALDAILGRLCLCVLMLEYGPPPLYRWHPYR